MLGVVSVGAVAIVGKGVDMGILGLGMVRDGVGDATFRGYGDRDGDGEWAEGYPDIGKRGCGEGVLVGFSGRELGSDRMTSELSDSSRFA